MCGEVETSSWEEAETFVADYGYKERVIGILIERFNDKGIAAALAAKESLE